MAGDVGAGDAQTGEQLNGVVCERFERVGTRALAALAMAAQVLAHHREVSRKQRGNVSPILQPRPDAMD